MGADKCFKTSSPKKKMGGWFTVFTDITSVNPPTIPDMKLPTRH